MLPNMDELRERHTALCDRMDVLAAALDRAYPQADQQHAPAYQEWQDFRFQQSVVLNSSGAGVVSFESQPIRPGFEAQVQRYAIVVQGASALATVTVYVREPDTLDGQVVDYASALFGASPAVSVSQNLPPIWLINGDYLTFGVAGAVASQAAVVTLQGRMRQV